MMNVFYSPLQCATTNSFSPSSMKPQYVVADWQQRFPGQIAVHDFEPVERDVFKRVHSPDHVDAILDGRANNGFGNKSLQVAQSLPYTTGSLLAAAEYAVLHGAQTCSPTSGFHHASYHHAGGYCTFNGLMATAVALWDAGLVQTVGIIDCDAHYGDGTQDIIDRLSAKWVRHHTLGGAFHSARDVYPVPGGGTTFARWLQKAICDAKACDLVIYQAGADPHVNDPLGGILTTEQMRERDRMVFEGLRGKALVWNLAGGYQTATEVPGTGEQSQAARLEPVLALHRNTMAEHLAVLSGAESRLTS